MLNFKKENIHGCNYKLREIVIWLSKGQKITAPANLVPTYTKHVTTLTAKSRGAWKCLAVLGDF